MTHRVYLKLSLLLATMLASTASNASECSSLLKNTGIENLEVEASRCFCGNDIKKFYSDDADYELAIKAICSIRVSASSRKMESILLLSGAKKIVGTIDVKDETEHRDYIVFTYKDKHTGETEKAEFASQENAFKMLNIPAKNIEEAFNNGFCGKANATLIINEASIVYGETTIIKSFTPLNIGTYKPC